MAGLLLPARTLGSAPKRRYSERLGGAEVGEAALY
jgi:hypothetical protein